MAQKISRKINGAQETEGCKEVKGNEGDEQCGVGEISQSVRKFSGCEISQLAKFHRLRKFANLEIFTLLQKLSAFYNTYKNRKPKIMRKHTCK